MTYITPQHLQYLQAKKDKQRRKEENDRRARANDPTIINFDPFAALMKIAKDAQRRQNRTI